MSAVPQLLPIAPSCTLDAPGLSAQRERYRAAGAGATVLERGPQALVIELASGVPTELVDELVAVERECCPFFSIDWRPDARRFSIAVERREYAPALDGIAFALGLGLGLG
jgi:hypothetical protein